MKFIQTGIPDLYIVEPTIFQDSRGYFYEAFNTQKFAESGINIVFNQDNQSKSQKGVIRGLHYQLDPQAQTKLIRVIKGTIYDVAVDIRKGSPTFGQTYGIELSSDNYKQLLVPQGFAHGFSVLSDEAIVLYKCDNLYHKASERGIYYADPDLNIDWQVDPKEAIVSEKDTMLPAFDKADMNFQY